MNNKLSQVAIVFFVLSPLNLQYYTIFMVMSHVAPVVLSLSMSWICFRKAVLSPLCVGKDDVF